MDTTLQTLMREATRLTQAGRLNDATQAIQRALGGVAGTPLTPTAPPTRSRVFTGGGATTAAMRRGAALILDGCVFETGARSTETQQPVQPPPQYADVDGGTFTGASYTHAGLTRNYKLYTPPASATSGRPSALVVMLHGCTQNPDDFAAGTNMNTMADEQGFMVLYPEQSQKANPSRCWNWFKHNHQRRGSGEPALIATLAQMVAHEHGIDPRRVYIAGLSAGAAMAAVVAAAYPEVFAAVGVHSGLPGGAATNVAEALALMKSGGGNGGMGGGMGAGIVGGAGLGGGGFGAQGSKATPAALAVPTIVFHGDQDQTVHPRNGEQVLAAALTGQATGSTTSVSGMSGEGTVEQGVSDRGRRYTRSVYLDGSGAPLAEHWVVHGAGHAWSGGTANGSYTDVTGPDASREMLRFFFSQPHGKPH
ncbi:MAG: PHB depolymerase family esterase [Pseudomonadota bacterium]